MLDFPARRSQIRSANPGLNTRDVVRYPKARLPVGGGWVEFLLGRRRPMMVAAAVANKGGPDLLVDDAS